MYHPGDPSLLLRYILPLEVKRGPHPPPVLHRRVRLLRRARVLLVLDEYVAELEHAIYILGGLDNRLVLEHGRHDGVCDRAPGREELEGEEWNVARDGKEREDGLVGVDGCNEQRGEVVDRLRRVQIRTAANC